jgi:hypothetical protein
VAREEGRAIPPPTNLGWQNPLEMSKMKIDPAMCMKTQVRRQNVTAKKRHFARNCTNRGIIDKNRAGFLAENAKFTP